MLPINAHRFGLLLILFHIFFTVQKPPDIVNAVTVFPARIYGELSDCILSYDYGYSYDFTAAIIPALRVTA